MIIGSSVRWYPVRYCNLLILTGVLIQVLVDSEDEEDSEIIDRAMILNSLKVIEIIEQCGGELVPITDPPSLNLKGTLGYATMRVYFRKKSEIRKFLRLLNSKELS